MKRLDDKAAYIKEIQSFLSFVIDDSGIVFKNGIYDDVTKNAVLRFKLENGLEENTVVDKETYDLLYKKYLKSKENVGISLKENDAGNDVLYLNTMLRAVANEYSDIGSPKYGRFYTAETERSVLKLKEIFRMQSTSGADTEFIKRLEREYKLTRS